MKPHILTFLLTAAALTACSYDKNASDKNTTAETIPTNTVPDADIRGQWYIENIVFDDDNYVRPQEEVPGTRQYIIFTDDTYSIMTNCNSISGGYTVTGDSIHLDDGAMTEIACDNMVTEDALRRLIPDISTVDMINDSILRLNCNTATAYIVLHKAVIETK